MEILHDLHEELTAFDERNPPASAPEQRRAEASLCLEELLLVALISALVFVIVSRVVAARSRLGGGGSGADYLFSKIYMQYFDAPWLSYGRNAGRYRWYRCVSVSTFRPASRCNNLSLRWAHHTPITITAARPSGGFRRSRGSRVTGSSLSTYEDRIATERRGPVGRSECGWLSGWSPPVQHCLLLPISSVIFPTI